MNVLNHLILLACATACSAAVAADPSDRTDESRKEIMRLQLEVSKMGEEIKALRENNVTLSSTLELTRERNASVTRYATALEYRLNLFLIEKARTLGQQDAGKALTQRNEAIRAAAMSWKPEGEPEEFVKEEIYQSLMK